MPANSPLYRASSLSIALLLFAALVSAGCSDTTTGNNSNNGDSDVDVMDAGDASPDTDDPDAGDSGDTSDTGDAGDTGTEDTGDATDADDTGDAADTEDTGDAADTEDTGDAADTEDTGGDADTDGGDTNADVDTGCRDDDNDGVCNSNDICAGFDDTLDADSDGVPDGCDGCPDDTNKEAAGLCGCGFADPTSGNDCPNDPGDIDDTFAPGSGTGIQILTDPAFDEARAAGVLDDSTILIGGWRIPAGAAHDFLALKLDANGSLASAFGSSGVVTTDFDGDTDRAYDLAFNPTSGVFALAGHAVDTQQRVAVAMYEATGTLDTTFDQDGRWTSTTFTGATLTGVELASSGGVVFGGDYGTPSTVLYGALTAAGAWDTSFQTNGYASYASGTGDVYAHALGFDGSDYYIAGATELGGDDDFFALSFDGTGALTSWASSGVAEVDASTPGASADRLDAVHVDSSGRILAAGEYRVGGGAVDVAVVRFDASGQPDASFGTNGIVRVDFGGLDRAFALTTQSDGKILVAGRSTQSMVDSVAIARLNSDGTLDTSFQTDGTLTLTLGAGTESEIRALAVQGDKLVVVGNVFDGSDQNIFIMRLYL